MYKDIKLNIAYLDFDFHNEFRGSFTNYKEMLNVLDMYLSCPKKNRWVENFLTIGIRCISKYDLEIERTFQSKVESTYRYIQRDEDKKAVLDLANISKEQVVDLVKKFFES